MSEKIADIKDIPKGKGLMITTAEGKEIALFCIDEEVYAIDNHCPHLGGPLAQGELEEDTVTCPWHGWRFNIKTGACENMIEEVGCPKIRVEKGSVYLMEDKCFKAD